MSEISELARATVFVTDFASLEPATNKLHSLGLAWQFTSLLAGGITPPMTVIGLVEVESKFIGDTVVMELALWDDVSGTLVSIPQPDGSTQIVRAAQNAVINKPIVNGVAVPPELPVRLQMLMGIPTGLPLAAGIRYRWQLSLDGNSDPRWVAQFYVTPSQTPIVFG